MYVYGYVYIYVYIDRSTGQRYIYKKRYTRTRRSAQMSGHVRPLLDRIMSIDLKLVSRQLDDATAIGVVRAHDGIGLEVSSVFPFEYLVTSFRH